MNRPVEKVIPSRALPHDIKTRPNRRRAMIRRRVYLRKRESPISSLLNIERHGVKQFLVVENLPAPRNRRERIVHNRDRRLVTSRKRMSRFLRSAPRRPARNPFVHNVCGQLRWAFLQGDANGVDDRVDSTQSASGPLPLLISRVLGIPVTVPSFHSMLWGFLRGRRSGR